MPDTPKKFYLTTPIYYVNARPHIGHAYSTIAADVIARRHRLLGDDTFFLTGTDEHGQKVQRSAEAAGIPPQQFADEVSATFRNLWKRMGITNDEYIRTTDERHKQGVQKLFRKLYEAGFIYLSTYTGAYCVSDEAFVDLAVGTPCPDCGRPLELVTEENFFFKLGLFQKALIELIERTDDEGLKIEPSSTRNEVLSFLRGNWMAELAQHFPSAKEHLRQLNQWDDGVNPTIEEMAQYIGSSGSGLHGSARQSELGNFYIPDALKDLSISRSSFTWGIPVPEDIQRDAGATQNHVVYVWLDALANYITAIGYGSDDPADKAKFEKYWPANLHLVGKEITRFHCVYWPAFLMAAGLPLPKAVVANGWLLFEESKMSKSRGNVVRTETILDAFGPLCPPVPLGPTTNTVILRAARSAQSKDPDAASPADLARTISTTESALTAPTKSQQDLFAADVLRYFLLREIPFGQDGSFSFDALITRYNADLANGYGNLVSRVLTMIEKNFDSFVPTRADDLEVSSRAQKIIFGGVVGPVVVHADGHLDDPILSALASISEGSFAPTDFAANLTTISNAQKALDALLTEIAPWKLTKDDSRRVLLATTLSCAAECIRWVTALLYPVMPYATASVWRQLGLGDIEEAARNGELKNLQWGGLKPGTKLGPLAPIFPRADKGLAQIMTDMENPQAPAAAKIPSPASEPVAPAATPADQSHPHALAPESSILAPAPDPDASGANPPLASQIAIDDFVKVDLRVARILVAERIPKADKLLRLEVDLGFEKRQILAGIAEYYAPETLIGRKVVIVANLAPRKMRGLESNGMIVAASIGPAGAPVLAGFLEDVELGARLK